MDITSLMYIMRNLCGCLSPLFKSDQNANQHQDREDNSHEDSAVEIIIHKSGAETNQGGTAGAADVTGQGEKRKHCRSSIADSSRRLAEGTGPHDSNG